MPISESEGIQDKMNVSESVRSDAIRHIRRSSSRILSEKIIVTRETGSSALPKTLYVVYGLESSGTTFVAQTLGTAIGVDIHRAFDRNALETFDKQTHIQHISFLTLLTCLFRRLGLRVIPQTLLSLNSMRLPKITSFKDATGSDTTAKPSPKHYTNTT